MKQNASQKYLSIKRTILWHSCPVMKQNNDTDVFDEPELTARPSPFQALG